MVSRLGIASCSLLVAACTNLSFSASAEDAKLVTTPSDAVSLERHDVINVTADYVFGATIDPATDGTWTSSDTAVATITGTGAHVQVHAIGPGMATIRVDGDIVETPLDVVVATPHTLSLLVSPPQPQTTIGNNVSMIAIASMSDGELLDVTASATWLSSNTAIATVSQGVIHGVSKGEATISAEVDDTFSSTRVTVK